MDRWTVEQYSPPKFPKQPYIFLLRRHVFSRAHLWMFEATLQITVCWSFKFDLSTHRLGFDFLALDNAVLLGATGCVKREQGRYHAILHIKTCKPIQYHLLRRPLFPAVHSLFKRSWLSSWGMKTRHFMSHRNEQTWASVSYVT